MRQRTVKVIEVITYEVEVRADDEEEAEETAINVLVEDPNPEYYCLGLTDRYAEVQD